MALSKDEHINRMIDILSQKKELLTEMLDLTNKQTGTIGSENLDDLELLIGEKQSRINAIDKLDEEFTLSFEEIKASIGIENLYDLDTTLYPELKNIKEKTEEVVTVVRSISNVEKFNSEKSKDLLNKIGGEIKKINQGKRVNNAYSAPQSEQVSFFVDNKK